MPKYSSGLLIFRSSGDRSSGDRSSGDRSSGDRSSGDRSSGGRSSGGRSSGGLSSFDPSTVEVLVVHPGGPLWAKKDDGAWSIPKGEHGADDDPLECARREFQEELGVQAPEGAFIDLGEIVQRGGKHVRAWAVRGDLDTEKISSNTFELEWPPRSGRSESFPEIDRAAWLSTRAAIQKLNPAQGVFVERLVECLSEAP